MAAPDESVSVLPEDGATPVAGAKDSAPIEYSTFEAMTDGAVDTAEATMEAAGEAVTTVGVGLQESRVDATEDKPVVEESVELPACEEPTSERGALYKQNNAVYIVYVDGSVSHGDAYLVCFSGVGRRIFPAAIWLY